MKLESGKETVLVISDLHAPFHHPDSLEFLKALKLKYKPTQIVCIGDEVDFHAFGRWEPDPNGMSPGDEVEQAVGSLQNFYKVFPKVKSCKSNHTERPYRDAFRARLPEQLLRPYGELLRAPKGWEWAQDWTVDGVLYEHGEGVSGEAGALKAAKLNRQSTVIGHVHSFAGVQFSTNRNNTIFGFNVGCLIDVDAYCFKYGITSRNKPCISAGIVNKGVPELVPMVLDKHGRWTGKL